MTATTKEKLLELVDANPAITISQAVDVLGVSRQRIHQIAKANDIVFRDGRCTMDHRLTIEEIRRGKSAPMTKKAIGASSELRVAIDLLERGLDVYKSMTSGGLCDLVFVDRNTGKSTTVEVKTAQSERGRKPPRSMGRQNKFDVLAIVYRCGGIDYYPDPFTSHVHVSAGRQGTPTLESVGFHAV